MKKAALLTFIVLSTIAAQAQETTTTDYGAPITEEQGLHKIDINKVRFGAFIAPNISWMHPTASKSDDDNYYVNSKGSKLGFTWGLMAEYFFSENYGLVSGFQINSTGGKIGTKINADNLSPYDPNTVLSTDFDYKLQYIEIPFALKLRSDEFKKNGIRIFGQIGLTLGVNIGKKATYTVVYNDQNATEETIHGDNEILKGGLAVAPVTLQMNLGAGVEYPLTEKLYLYCGLFFNNGFLPDATNPKNFDLNYRGSFSDGNTRLNSFALRIGIFF